MVDFSGPAASVSLTVLITGGTGYLGRALVPALLARGHRVRLLVRPGSEGKVPAGAEAIAGDPLDAASVAAALREADTLVHLVGVPEAESRDALRRAVASR